MKNKNKLNKNINEPTNKTNNINAKPIKIACAVSAGGHLTEMNMILSKEVLKGCKKILLTEKTKRTENMKGVYFFKPFSYNPLPFIPAFLKCYIIFRKEKPDLVFSTGAEIAVPAILVAKFLGIKTMFVDDAMRVKTPTLAGKICYPFTDIFLVPYSQMKEMYGKKTQYWGGII